MKSKNIINILIALVGFASSMVGIGIDKIFPNVSGYWFLVPGIILFIVGIIGLVKTIFPKNKHYSSLNETEELNKKPGAHAGFVDTANTFRSTVLNALEGIYPVTKSWWDKSAFSIFEDSLPKIETAAAIFSYHISDKNGFDQTIKAYREYCQKKTYMKGVPRFTYPNSPKPPNAEPDPVEEFKRIIEEILSFTEVTNFSQPQNSAD